MIAKNNDRFTIGDITYVNRTGSTIELHGIDGDAETVRLKDSNWDRPCQLRSRKLRWDQTMTVMTTASGTYTTVVPLALYEDRETELGIVWIVPKSMAYEMASKGRDDFAFVDDVPHVPGAKRLVRLITTDHELVTKTLN